MSGLGFKVESVCPQTCPPVAERLKGSPAGNCHAASQGPGDSLRFLRFQCPSEPRRLGAASDFPRLSVPTLRASGSERSGSLRETTLL